MAVGLEGLDTDVLSVSVTHEEDNKRRQDAATKPLEGEGTAEAMSNAMLADALVHSCEDEGLRVVGTKQVNPAPAKQLIQHEVLERARV